MAERPKVLLITYHFPPGGGVSVQRVLSFAKYLPQNGFSVRVLMPRNGAYPVYDYDLLNEIPEQVEVTRSFTPEIPYFLRKRLWNWFSGVHKARPVLSAQPGDRPASAGGLSQFLKNLFCPDPQVVWTPFAIRRATRLIRKHGIDIVLITAPPFSTFLIGPELKRRFPQITLVSDFRDEWLLYYLGNVESFGSDFKRLRAEAIERETVEYSDMVVATTQSTLSRIRSRYPGQPAAKFVHIPNGYDPDRFSGFSARPREDKSTLVITYMGTVYKPCSPRRYLEALGSLPESVRGSIETRFIGRVTDEEQEVFRNTSARTKLLGFLPQKEGLQRLEETDYLLLIVDDEVSIAGKTFEYLATGKPVLALIPPGSETDTLLRGFSGAIRVDSRDTGAIRSALAGIYDAFTRGEILSGAARSEISRFERPRLVAALGEAIRERCKASPVTP